MDTKIAGTPLAKDQRNLNIGILVSGFFVLLFLATAFTFSINDQILNNFFKKESSSASNGTYSVFPDSTVSVPLRYVGASLVNELDFTASVTGGILVELICGGQEFTADQVRSRGTRCLVGSASGASAGQIATAVVTAGPIGTVNVLATGTVKASNKIVGENIPISQNEYEILINDVAVGSKVVVPITLDSPNEPVTAADFTTTVSGASLDEMVCGGFTFQDTRVAKEDNHCIVFSAVGQNDATIASAIITADKVGTVTIGVNGKLSTGSGTYPADGMIVGTVFTVTQ